MELLVAVLKLLGVPETAVSNSHCIASNGKTAHKRRTAEDLEVSSLDIMEALSRQMPEGSELRSRKSQSSPVKIRTSHFPIKVNRHTTLFGV
jgi:hypothetical protein